MNKKKYDLIEESLNYHSQFPAGKLQIYPTKQYNSQKDLSLAYSPGVSAPCQEIFKSTELVSKYTNKGNLVGIITNGTAVLGLGNIGSLAAKPVMEGKGLLFKIFAGLDAFDIEINENDPKNLIQIVKSISNTFGGINLEDIKSPESFEIEQRIKSELNIPVMHDDQHGTAIISGVALINALEIVNKKIQKIKIVINGAGSAAISCAKIYKKLGSNPENIIMLDSQGIITNYRKDLPKEKKEFAIPTKLNNLDDAIKGADVFIGLSIANIFTPKMLLSMNKNPIVFGMANPNPEIRYELALKTRSDVILATGRSDYPNQVNNVLGFTSIFRGALDVKATVINEKMKLAAIFALADLAKKPVTDQIKIAYNKKNIVFGKDYIIPKPIDSRLIQYVAPAVAKAAMETGVARTPITNWETYKKQLVNRINRILER